MGDILCRATTLRYNLDELQSREASMALSSANESVLCAKLADYHNC